MSVKKNFIVMIASAIGVYAVVFMLSLLINEDIDKNILAFLNPDAYIPVIDELMVGITDLSLVSFCVVFALWFLGYFCLINIPNSAQPIQRFFKIISISMGIVSTSVYFWGIYEYKIIFLVWGPVMFLTLWFAGKSLTTMNKDQLQKATYAFLLMLISIIFSNAIGEVITKIIIARDRPLSDSFAPWNEILRTMSDAITMDGHSYVSGHASSLFALMTPLMWITPKRHNKIVLFVWASIHAFTRIYVGAHWPYDVLIGAAMGFVFGTIVVKIFYNPEFHLTDQLLILIQQSKEK
jgi:membrane-associated phospholipid phosphatase